MWSVLKKTVGLRERLQIKYFTSVIKKINEPVVNVSGIIPSPGYSTFLFIRVLFKNEKNILYCGMTPLTCHNIDYTFFIYLFYNGDNIHIFKSNF